MKAGDHVRIMKASGWVHAIDVGDRTLIHFADGAVRRSHLFDVATDGARIEVVTHAERTFAPRQVVARAFSRFADAAYAAMFESGEAFALWCKTGRLPPAPLTGVEPAPAARKPAAKAAPAPARQPAARKAAARKATTATTAAKKAAPRKAASKKAAAAKPARKVAGKRKPARKVARKATRTVARKAKPASKAAARGGKARAAAGKRSRQPARRVPRKAARRR